MLDQSIAGVAHWSNRISLSKRNINVAKKASRTNQSLQCTPEPTKFGGSNRVRAGLYRPDARPQAKVLIG